MERGMVLNSIKIIGVRPKQVLTGIGRSLIQVIYEGEKG